jgi:zinc transport system ATP-binding protein
MLERTAPSGIQPVVHIENLSVYYGQTAALSKVSLDIRPGEFLGIIGPNGGGKSTLIKAILGLVPITAGCVELDGQPAAGGQSHPGYVPQFSSLDRRFPITVFEVVLSGLIAPGLRPFFRFSQADQRTAAQMLGQVGITKLRKRLITELSGGEFQKMLIARALVSRPSLLLLDEPTASVDTSSRDQIFSLLSELKSQMTIVLVTHDLLAISSHVSRLACLNGNLVYHGEPALSEKVVQQLYGCPVDLIAHGVPHRVLQTHHHDHPNGQDGGKGS